MLRFAAARGAALRSPCIASTAAITAKFNRSSRCLVTGAAQQTALQARTQLSPRGLEFFRLLGRSGWPAACIGFGGDDPASTVAERAGLLHAAVLHKGANVVFIDGDHITARRIAGGRFFTAKPVERDWEQHALSKLLLSGRVARSELIITARLSVGPVSALDGEIVALSALRSRVHALCIALDLQTLDVLHVQVPSNTTASSSSAVQLSALCAELEQLVGLGFIQYYTISCEAFRGERGVSGVSIVELLAAARESAGIAASTRKSLLESRCSEAALGNCTSFPDHLRVGLRRLEGWEGGGSSATTTTTESTSDHQDQQLDTLALDPTGHHLLGISLPCSLASAAGILSGEVGTIAEREGLALFLRSPFDAVLELPEGGTLLSSCAPPSSDSAATSSDDGPKYTGGLPVSVSAGSEEALGAVPTRKRPFRCVAPPVDDAGIAAAMAAAAEVSSAAANSVSAALADIATLPSQPTAFEERAEQGRLLRRLHDEGVVPPQLLSALEEGLAAAIHMELLWGAKIRVMVEGSSGGSADDSDKDEERGCEWMAGLPAPVQHELRRLFSASVVGACSSTSPPDLPAHATQSARALAGSFASLDNWLEWRLTRGRTIQPALAAVQAACEAVPAGSGAGAGGDEPRQWAAAYVAAVNAVLQQLDTLLDAAQAARVRALGDALTRANITSSNSSSSSVIVDAVAGLLLAAHPNAVVLTEVPAAFGVRRRSDTAIRAQAAAAAAARRKSTGAGDRDEEEENVDGAAAAARAEDAAREARRAARAAEIDAIIAGTSGGEVAPSEPAAPVVDVPAAPVVDVAAAPAATAAPQQPRRPAPQPWAACTSRAAAVRLLRDVAAGTGVLETAARVPLRIAGGEV